MVRTLARTRQNGCNNFDGDDVREATSWRMPDVAALVHVHPQAIAWQSEDPNKLQVVTNTSRGLVPGGYCVSPAHFRDLQHDPAKVTQLTTAARISLKMPPVVRIDSAALGHWRAVFTEPGQVGISKTLDSWRLARELAAAVVSRQRTSEVLDQLIGIGEGTKPVGDQVVVGVLAGLSARRQRSDELSLLVRERLDRTTASGRHDLAWAIDGEFSERIHMIVLSLHTPAAARAQARRAGGWRGASGLDLACGVMAGIEAPGVPTPAHVRTRG